MKFAISTLFTLALAMGVQSSILPLGGVVTQIAGGHLSHTAVVSPLGLPLGGPLVLGPHPAAIPAAVSLPVHAPAVAVHAPALAVHAPSVAVHAPAVHAPAVAVHAPAVVGGHASYVAKTRGAVHAAPLAGHLNSVANVNVAPAPGTH
ncbi:adult cuticle protein 1-like isoform 2-T2 [Cochliomyia hominivorax]